MRLNRMPLLIVLFAFLLPGCAMFQKMIEKPEVEFKNLSMQEMSLFQGTLVFHFAVTNPNAIDLPANELTYDLKIDGRPFINGKLDKGIQLPAKKTEMVAIPVKIEYASFFSSLAEIFKKESIAYDLTGTFGKFGLSVPFQTKGTLPVPKLPKISVKEVNVENLSFKGAALDVLVEMENENGFPVPLKGFDYVLSLGGKKIAQSRADTKQPLSGKGKSSIKIPVNLDFFEMGQAAANLLNNSRSDYELTGAMRLDVPGKGEERFDYSMKGEAPFTRSSSFNK